MPFDLHIASYTHPTTPRGLFGAYMNFQGDIRWEAEAFIYMEKEK